MNTVQESTDDQERRMLQTNIFNILNTFILALAPIMPTTCEELYLLMNPTKKSVHLADFFTTKEVKTEIFEQWKPFFTLVDQVNKVLEVETKNGNIKRRNEALVTIKVEDEFLKGLNLRQLLNVGEVELGNDFKASTFESVKCQRCWNHTKTELINEELCPRCRKVLGL